MQRVFILTLSLVMLLTTDVKSRESAIEAVDTENLRVCADPANMPFSNDKQQGYENEIASATMEVDFSMTTSGSQLHAMMTQYIGWHYG